MAEVQVQAAQHPSDQWKSHDAVNGANALGCVACSSLTWAVCAGVEGGSASRFLVRGR